MASVSRSSAASIQSSAPPGPRGLAVEIDEKCRVEVDPRLSR
jgi:hypothetical protein